MRNVNINVDDIKSYLNEKNKLLNVPRKIKDWSPYYASGVGMFYNADLTFYGTQKHNKVILTIVDVYHKHVVYILVKNKTKKVINEAFIKYFTKGVEGEQKNEDSPLTRVEPPPVTNDLITVVTDDGHEFERNDLYIDDGRILRNMRSSGDGTAKLAEAYNALLKKAIRKIYIGANIKPLDLVITQDLLNTITNHINLGRPDNKHKLVADKIRLHEDFKDLYVKDSTIVQKFNVGDQVRLANTSKKTFEKASMSGLWTEEVYTITKVKYYSKAYKYRLNDEDGDDVNAWFYDVEMQLV